MVDAAAELLSEPRASEHEASSHMGVCEGRICRRVLSASLTSRVARLAEAIVVVVDALARAVLRLRRAASRTNMPLIKGGMSGAHERVWEKTRTEAESGAQMCARHWGRHPG